MAVTIFISNVITMLTFFFNTFFSVMTQDWKGSYRMPFVAVYRKWDKDVCKSWKSRLVLGRECHSGITAAVDVFIPLVFVIVMQVEDVMSSSQKKRKQDIPS